MGGGSWSTDAYTARHESLRASGKSSFGYTDDTLSQVPRDQWKVHETLDVMNVDVRESRDSDEHPESLAITVLFDVTGSMAGIPRVLQAKLADLFGLLLRKGYVEHPQLMFGGIGDANWDRVPIQISQWESDNRSDEQLGNLVLEGGGGGGGQESYELSMYFLARHTAMDCLEKRGQKGYLFVIGDEMAYPRINRQQVQEHIGDTLEADIDFEDIVAELTDKFEVFFLFPAQAHYARQDEHPNFWRRFFGERMIMLADADAVCETIALAIGLQEGAIDLDEGIDHLTEAGTDVDTINVVRTALTTVGAGIGGQAAKVEGTLEAGAGGADDVGRM